MRRLPLSRLLPLGCFLLGWAVIYGVTLIPTGRAVDSVIVEMEVQQGTRVELFWNAFADPPVSSAISGGQRSRLEFRPPTSNLQIIRIDPSLRANEDIIIYRVALRLRDGSTFEIPLTDIVTWNTANMTKPVLVDGRLTSTSTTSDPYLYGPTNLPPSSRLEQVLISAHASVLSNELIVQLVIIGAVAVALASLTPVNAALLGLTMLVPLLVLYFGPGVIERIIGPDAHPVAIAIGPAALNGLSIAPTRWATLLAALAASGFAFSVWARGRHAPNHNLPDTVISTTEILPESTPSRPWREALIALLSVLALLLLLMPDLNGIARSQMSGAFYPHWDSNNITTWSGLIAQGKRPYIDFWYPYSGFWVFELSLPVGPLLRFLFYVALYWALGMAIWRLVDRRVLFWLGAMVLIFLLARGGVVPAAERYFLGMTVAVAYVASPSAGWNGHFGRIWFWVACALALWGEPVQLIYALPAIVIVFLHDETWANHFQLRRIAMRLVADFAVPFVMLMCLLGFLAYRGELAGFIETNRLTAESGIYAMMPTNIGEHFPALLSVSSIGVIWPFLLLAIGMAGLFKPSCSSERRLALAVVCCGLVGVMVLQKHLIRPIGAQLLGPSVVGAILVFPLFLSQFRTRLLSAIIFGAIAALVVVNASLTALARYAIAGAIDRVESDYTTFATDPSIFERARKAAFDRSHMANHRQELAVIDRLQGLGVKTWFVLTDMPVFYLYSEGPTPFQINHYNTSPIRAQIDIRSWIARTKPEVVILDPTALEFDSLQLVVREPLVAIEVILNYVPFDRTGPYHLLVRRKQAQPIDLAYWLEILGPKVAFGHILGYTAAPTMPPCVVIANAMCTRYLELTFDAETASPQPIELPVTIGPSEFKVSFVRERGSKTQYVPIDRIWFWVAGEAMGLVPGPQLPANVTARIVGKNLGRESLY